MERKIYALALVLVSFCFAVAGRGGVEADATIVKTGGGVKANRVDTATFAMGCFWCTQAQFQLLKGVKKVVAGYTGGHVASPTYRLVCTGTTGHAEACNIIYDPAQITYDELLAAFFTAH